MDYMALENIHFKNCFLKLRNENQKIIWIGKIYLKKINGHLLQNND